MSDVVESKTTKIGNSLWVLIPKEVVEERKIEEGQLIKIAILDKERNKTVNETFGMFRGAKGFKRIDHLERRL
jgi:antitoxin component of MazEF toxin-antitoxin module